MTAAVTAQLLVSSAQNVRSFLSGDAVCRYRRMMVPAVLASRKSPAPIMSHQMSHSKPLMGMSSAAMDGATIQQTLFVFHALVPPWTFSPNAPGYAAE
jgi:hypothetical protein